MELKDTIAMMESEDFKERFRAEYFQTRIRCEKLHAMIVKYEAGTLPFKPKSGIAIFKEQKRCMEDYLYYLEVRAEIEGIDLEQDVITIEAKTSWWRYAAIAFGLLFLLYLFCGANVPDKGNGADKVRTEIKAAGQANKELQDRLETATGTVEQLQGSISKAETAAERIAENLAAAEQNNSECQSILRNIRARSETQGTNN